MKIFQSAGEFRDPKTDDFLRYSARALEVDCVGGVSVATKGRFKEDTYNASHLPT
jgi:hypothetical protein